MGPFRSPRLLLLLLLLSYLLISIAKAQQCTVCKDGSDISLPEKDLNVDGIPVQTCQELAITGSFLSAESELCVNSIQRVGTLCGCPVEENSCSLCINGSTATNATLVLEDYQASTFLFGAPPGVPMTCEAIEAVLHSYDKDDDSSTCGRIQRDVAGRCGCPFMDDDNDDDDENENDDNGKNSTTPSPTSSPAPSAAMCTLCLGGEDILYPDKSLELGDLPISTCSDLFQFAGLLTSGSEECMGIQSLGPLCGCPLDNVDSSTSCGLCPNGEALPNPHRKLNWFSSYSREFSGTFESIGNSLTCEMMESSLLVPDNGELFGTGKEFLCLTLHLKSGVCGCSPDWRQKALVWLNRIAASLSIFGSCSIIWSILRKPKTRKTTYHQMVLGISFFDLSSSLAYLLSGIMTPVEDGFYLAKGNATTCSIQAFMIQLGYTSIYYNLGLSLYFLMVIKFNWKEHEFNRILPYVHGATLTTGIGLAFAGLPFYGGQFSVCSIIPPPAVSSWLPITFLYTVPVATVLILITAITFIICLKVYRQQKKAFKWSLQQNLRLSRRVFWQSFWYMIAFYTAIPFLLLTYYWPYSSKNDIWLFIIGAILGPSQGFLNGLVYFQRSGILSNRQFFEKARKKLRETLSVFAMSRRGSTISLDTTKKTATPMRDKPSSGPLDTDDGVNKNDENGLVDGDGQGEPRKGTDDNKNIEEDVVKMMMELELRKSAQEDPSDDCDHPLSALFSEEKHEDDLLPPPPPPPPPPLEADPGSPIVEWLRRENDRGERRTSLSTYHDSYEEFAATREYFFLNYIGDNDLGEGDGDGDDEETPPPPANLRQTSSWGAHWARIRRNMMTRRSDSVQVVERTDQSTQSQNEP